MRMTNDDRKREMEDKQPEILSEKAKKVQSLMIFCLTNACLQAQVCAPPSSSSVYRVMSYEMHQL